MIVIKIKKEYLNTDTDIELVFKNKDNIIDLYENINKLQGQDEELAYLVGEYLTDDPNGELDDALSVIRNLVIVKENLTAAILRIDSVEARVTTIENDGISFYIGTFKGADENDSSVLPVDPQAQDNDRAIVEFVVADDVKYQEWQYKLKVWTKIGVVLDSHIHSQSVGITLQDVATQQDPKIAKSLTDSKTYTDSKEKKWTIIDDLWTNPLKFEKYKDIPIKFDIGDNVYDNYIYVIDKNFSSKKFQAISSQGENGNTSQYWLDETIPNKMNFRLGSIPSQGDTKIKVWI